MCKSMNSRFILKTSKGYLTYNGFAQDINNPRIIVLNFPNIDFRTSAGSTPLDNFLKHCRVSISKSEIGDWRVLKYECDKAYCYYCGICDYHPCCAFWSERDKLDLLEQN